MQVGIALEQRPAYIVQGARGRGVLKQRALSCGTAAQKPWKPFLTVGWSTPCVLLACYSVRRKRAAGAKQSRSRRSVIVACGTARSNELQQLDHIRKYDPEAIREFFEQRPLTVALRAAQAASAFAVVGIGWLWDGLQSDSATRERNLAARIREAFIGLGPTFVKLGQTLSCRPDLFSEEVLAEFERLQDNVPPFDHALAMEIVKAELGLDSLSQCFQEIGDAPVAAASLGQVYRARLRNGAEVAVKIQRPEAADTIALDLFVARKAAACLSGQKDVLPEMWQDTNLVDVVDEFGARLLEEVDYENEVSNAKRFAKLYGSQPSLKVPKVYDKYVTRRLAVLEWINGVKLTDLKGMKRLGLDPLRPISINIECSMRQLLEHGFFHADPHPGNFLVTPEGDLCVLDFGMMCDMTKAVRLNLISHVVHFANRDYASMAKDYQRLGFLDESIDTTPIGPQLEAHFDARLRGATLASVGFSTIVDGVGAVVFSQYKCSVPAFYALIVRSLVNLEGLALSVDQDYKMLAAVYPYFARRILVDADLRQSLLELLFEGAEAAAATNARSAKTRFRWDRVPGLLEASDRAGAKVAAKDERGATSTWSGDSTVYQDFAGSLAEDPIFREAALQELAKASELFMAERVSEWLGNTDDETVRQIVALEDTDQKALDEVRVVAVALTDRLTAVLPRAEEVGGLAFEAARRFATTGNSGLPSLPSMPSVSSDLFGDFVQRLRERVIVRALKATSRVLDPSSSRKTGKTGGSGDAKLRVRQ